MVPLFSKPLRTPPVKDYGGTGGPRVPARRRVWRGRACRQPRTSRWGVTTMETGRRRDAAKEAHWQRCHGCTVRGRPLQVGTSSKSDQGKARGNLAVGMSLPASARADQEFSRGTIRVHSRILAGGRPAGEWSEKSGTGTRFRWTEAGSASNRRSERRNHPSASPHFSWIFRLEFANAPRTVTPNPRPNTGPTKANRICRELGR